MKCVMGSLPPVVGGIVAEIDDERHNLIEQQMLALERALMSAPKILLIDEPSLGLAPVLVKRSIEKTQQPKVRYHLTVLMAEHNFDQAVRIAERGHVIVHGRIAFEGASAEALNDNELVRKFYLGL